MILMHTKHPYQTNDSHLFDVEKIHSHIIRIRMPGNVFTYYIKGDNSGILIDTGLATEVFVLFWRIPQVTLPSDRRTRFF